MLYQAGAHQSPEPPHEEGSAPQLVGEQDVGEAHNALHQPPAQELSAEDCDGPVAVELRLDGLLGHDCGCAEQHAKDQPSSRNGWQQHPLHKAIKPLKTVSDFKESMTVVLAHCVRLAAGTIVEEYKQYKQMTQSWDPEMLTMLECWAKSTMKWTHGQAHRHRMAAR